MAILGFNPRPPNHSLVDTLPNTHVPIFPAALVWDIFSCHLERITELPWSTLIPSKILVAGVVLNGVGGTGIVIITYLYYHCI